MRIRTPYLFLALAGLCWTTGQAVLPDMARETAQRYDLVAADRGAQAWSAALLVLAGWFLVLGALAVSRALAPRRGSRGARLLTVGTGMLALGGIWLAAGRGAFNIAFLRATDPGVPRDAGIAMLDAVGGFEFAPLLLTLPALLLGPVVLTIGLRRAGMGSWLPVVLWVAGIGTFLASEFTVKAGEVAGIGLAAVALALIGRATSATSVEADHEQRASVVPAAVDGEGEPLRVEQRLGDLR